MPRTPINYSKSIIYKLCCKNPEIKDIYIGSTTDFRKRKYSHKTACLNTNNKKFNRKVYNFIRDNGNWENWDMVMIEEYKDCENKLQLEKKERYYIEQLNSTLNCNIPTRTVKEYETLHREKINERCRKYVLENEEKINKWRKEYYQKNKENIQKKDRIRSKQYRIDNKEKLRTKMSCDCGSIFNKRALKEHLKTKKHIKYLENNNE